MDITQLILDDHAEQRRLFSIIEQIDPKDTEALSAVWGRLSAFLDVHAEAEERFFYPDLMKRATAPMTPRTARSKARPRTPSKTTTSCVTR